MNIDCGYDSRSSSMELSDCLSLCIEQGCSEDLLYNDSCDVECDIPECGFDKGNCGYCWSGCFELDLLDSVQSFNCDNRHCYYDSSNFKECSPGCTNQKLLNSSCDLECNTSLCNFDFRNCIGISNECSEGCFTSYLGNGICNEECNNQACSFDDYDCLCAPECTPELLTNGVCDEVCNKGTCEDDCMCDPKCENSDGDGICDEDCWNELCGWIDTDCGCSAGCRLDEIANCKKECLVLDCNFGDMGGSYKCEDTLKLELARAYQIINADFTISTSVEDCEFASLILSHEACTEDLLRNNPCYISELGEQPCNNIDCGYALGACNSDCECGESSSCFGNESSSCLTCSDKYQFFSMCVDECPLGFEPSSSNLCLPVEDNSTVEFPREYYVKNGMTDYGDGSEERPFSSVSIALASIYSKFSILHLEENEHYTLSSPPSDLVFIAIEIKRPLSRAYFKPEKLTVQGKNSFLEIKSEDFITFDAFYGILEFQSLTFSVPNLSSECVEECDYCEEECEGDCIPDCQVFENYAFISISSGASLLLSDISFKNMRNKFEALIYIEDGSAELRNVDFERVTVSSTGVIIIKKGERFNYVNGTVSLLNDGYEIKLDEPYLLKSFLDVEGVNYVKLEKIDFRYNIVHFDSLIKIENSNHLDMDSCEFHNNIINNYLLIFEQLETPSFTLVKNSNNTIYELTYDHVNIKNIIFRTNLIHRNSLIRIKTVFKNIFLENIEIENLFARLRTPIGIDSESNGRSGYKKLYINGIKKLGYFAGLSMTLFNLSMTRSIVNGRSCFHTANFENVYIQSLSIQNITDEEVDINEFIMADFTENTSSSYQPQKLTTFGPMGTPLQFEAITKMTLKDSTLSDLSIAEEPLMTITDGSELMINNMVVANIEIFSSSYIILIRNVTETLIQNSIFTNCTNWDALGAGIFFFSKMSYERTVIENCTMANNKAAYGGGIVSNQDVLIINNSTFENNESFSMSAGAVLFVSNSNSNLPFFSLSNSYFIGNSATLLNGGAITINYDASVEIEFQISHCEFKDNFAKVIGSAIRIQTGMVSSPNSYICNCIFQNNTAEMGAVAVSNDGYLLIDSCEFYKNKGESSAGIYYDGRAALDLVVQNSAFRNNSGFSVIHVDNLMIFSNLTTADCRFEYNSAKPLAIIYTNWIDFNSEFNYNIGHAEGGTGSDITDFSVCTLKGTKFFKNEAKSGSALLVRGRSIATCDGCTFDSNVAYDTSGAILVKQSALSIHNSVIIKNSSINGSAGALMFSDSIGVQNNITNTEISYNQAGTGGFIIVVNRSLLMLNGIKYHGNTASSDHTGILLNLGTLIVESSEFYNQEAISVPCILGSMGELYVMNSSFHDNLSSEFSGAIALLRMTAEIIGTDFFDLKAFDGGAIQSSSDSYLTVDSCSFSRIETVRFGLVTGQDTSLKIRNSFFSHFSGNGAFCQLCDTFIIENSNFSYGTGINGVGINIKSSPAKITGSSFSFLSASSNGGAVFSNSDDTLDLVIFNSTFFNNTSHGGGAIYTLNNSLNVTHSSFQANGAYRNDRLEGNGGGILIECNIECEHHLLSNVFVENEATFKGGGVHWKDREPNFEANLFQRNSATYGDGIASFPIEIIEIKPERRLDDINPTILYLEDVAPGQLISEVKTLGLRDHYGQIIETDNDSRVVLSAVDPEVKVTGTTMFVASGGLFNLSNYLIEGTPNSTVAVLLVTTAIDKAEDIYPEVLMNVKLRGCIPGEVNIRNSCVKCSKNSYSLDPSDNVCLDCPGAAVCEGGNLIYPRTKYWRSSEFAHEFWLCPNPDACLGGNNSSVIGRCAEGYKGNQCQSCEVGYSRSTANKCIECLDLEWEIVKFIGISLTIALVAILIIRSSLKSASRPKSMHSIYFKILVNFIQLVMMTSAFDLDWPDYVLELFRYQEETGSVANHLFSFDCFFFRNSSDIYFTKLILFTVFPFGLLLISLVFWGIIAIAKWNVKFIYEEMVSTDIVLIFLIHPNLIGNLFGALNCTEIDKGEHWLVDDLDIRCWDSEHSFYAFAIALPSIILWGFVVPIGIFSVLFRNKKRLVQLNVRKKYGFLFNGFSTRTYYWEIVILYRKIAVLSCAVALRNLSIQIQALCAIIVLLGSIYIQKKYNPYSQLELNRIEFMSILTIACTIYCGLFYLTGDLSEVSKILLFIVIVSLNLYFLILWFFGLSKICVKAISARIPSFKKFFTKKKYIEFPLQEDLPDENDLDKISQISENILDLNMKDLFLKVLNRELIALNHMYSFSHYNYSRCVESSCNDELDQIKSI